jgi:peptidoglycan/LPS O-acetylase OafA/YrhL
LRIFPLYYLVLIILVLLNIDSVREYWYYYFFYFSNHLYSDHFVIDRLSHFWSLAVEEQFYLVWPLLIFLIPFRWIKVPFFVVLTVLSQAFIFYSMFVVKDQGWYIIMPACIQSFALGAIAMLLQGKKIPSRYLNILAAVMVLLILFIASLPYLAELNLNQHAFRLAFDRLVQSILFAALLLLITNNNYMSFFHAVLNNKILISLGKVSYGVYVYHIFVPGMLVWIFDSLNITPSSDDLMMVMKFLLTFGISYVSFYFFELPINKLKKSFTY